MPGSEVQELADYGYKTGYAIGQLLRLGDTILPASFLVLYWQARRRAKNEDVKQVLLSASICLKSFLSLQSSWSSLLLLPAVYTFLWCIWSYVPENPVREWILENFYELSTLVYSIFSAFWLSKLYQHWYVAKEKSVAGEPLGKICCWTLFFCMVAVGFGKATPFLYSAFFVFYAFVAIRANLCLAFLFTNRGSLLRAAGDSFNFAHGRFWELARLFSSASFFACAAFMGRQYFYGLDLSNILEEPIFYNLLGALVDTLAALIWLFLDSIILLRGLEYLELRKKFDQ